MGRLEDRLRKLEEQLVEEPTCQEYLDADNREKVRALYVLAERAALHGFDSGYLLNEYSFRMLAEDTLDQKAKDREIIDAWCEVHGRERAEVEGAKERLLARLEAHSNKAAPTPRLHKTVYQQ